MFGASWGLRWGHALPPFILPQPLEAALLAYLAEEAAEAQRG